jgi:hypothetical protein
MHDTAKFWYSDSSCGVPNVTGLSSRSFCSGPDHWEACCLPLFQHEVPGCKTEGPAVAEMEHASESTQDTIETQGDIDHRFVKGTQSSRLSAVDGMQGAYLLPAG